MEYRILCICALLLIPSVLGLNFYNETKFTQDKFAAGINRFSANFYKTLAKNVEGNFISSPVSVFTVLAMAAYGARGKTKLELSKTLQLSFTKKYVARNLYRFKNHLNNVTHVDLRLANGLFIDPQFSVNPNFAFKIKTIFESKIEQMNSDKAAAARVINDWCRNETNNKITNIVTSDQLLETQLLMINAVYFKGTWKKPFDESESLKFHLSNGSVVFVPTMCHYYVSYNFDSVLNSTARYVELAYKTDDANKGVSMYIILPNEDKSVDEIGKNIHKIDFRKLNSREQITELCIPKFEIESQLKLKSIVEKMGIRKLFGGDADLSNINVQSNLKVGDVIQKAFISVDEKGSEAGASSFLYAVPLSGAPKPSFKANRPFIFAIVSKMSGTPLFWGRVMDPRTPLV